MTTVLIPSLAPLLDGAVEWVTHDDPIEPTTCLECELGWISRPEWEGESELCPDCNGTCAVPAVVTLAVCADVRQAGDSWWVKDVNEWIEVDEPPVPRPVATATVAECLDMHDADTDINDGDGLTEPWQRHIIVHNGRVWLCFKADDCDEWRNDLVTSRIVGAVAPGRWALHLECVQRVEP